MASAMHRLMIISITALSILNGCTTALQVEAKNQTSMPQILSVLVAEDPQKIPIKKLETEVDANSSIKPIVVGNFKPDALVTLKMSLRTGGVTKRAMFTIPSTPDPYLATIESKRISAPDVDLSDATVIEKQVTNIRGSYPSPTGDIGAFVAQHLGGLYVKVETSGNEIKLQRVIDPKKLGSQVTVREFMPAIAPPPEFNIVLTTDSSNIGIVQAQLPTIVDLKASLSATELHRHDIKMKDSAWRFTPHSWYAIEKKLQETQAGKKTYDDIRNLLISNQELFYLDSAFVLGGLELDIHSAESIAAEVDVTSPPAFIHAGGAYQWKNVEDGQKVYKNVVLRVSYTSLRPAVVTPHQKYYQQAGTQPQSPVIKPIFTVNPNRSEPIDRSVFLEEAKGDIQNVSIISSRAESFDPKFRLIYEVP